MTCQSYITERVFQLLNSYYDKIYDTAMEGSIPLPTHPHILRRRLPCHLVLPPLLPPPPALPEKDRADGMLIIITIYRERGPSSPPLPARRFDVFRSFFLVNVVGRIVPQYAPPAPYFRFASYRIGYLFVIILHVIVDILLRRRRRRHRLVRRDGIITVIVVIVVIPMIGIVYPVVDVRTLPTTLVDVEYLRQIRSGILHIVDVNLDQSMSRHDLAYSIHVIAEEVGEIA